MDNIRPYLDQTPRLGERVYIDESARVIGEVVLGDDVSVWPLTVIRGDVNFVRIGDRTNVQDGTVIHVSHDGPHAKLGGFATVIGADCTIGHKAIVHACRIEDACLIGMGSTVLDGAVVRKHGFLGAGSLLTPGKVMGEGDPVGAGNRDAALKPHRFDGRAVGSDPSPLSPCVLLRFALQG